MRTLPQSGAQFPKEQCAASAVGGKLHCTTLERILWTASGASTGEMASPSVIDVRRALTHIAFFLRQKLEEHPDDPEIILAELGIGYRLAEG